MTELITTHKRELLIGIIGADVMSGKYIIEELMKHGYFKGISVPLSSNPTQINNHRYKLEDDVNLFFQTAYESGIININPGYEVMSVYYIQNDYGLTKECLRELKLKEIGI